MAASHHIVVHADAEPTGSISGKLELLPTQFYEDFRSDHKNKNTSVLSSDQEEVIEEIRDLMEKHYINLPYFYTVSSSGNDSRENIDSVTFADPENFEAFRKDLEEIFKTDS